ncbi:MAG: ribonuclease / adenosylcobalamin/alpha-ribazole phosphatase [Actinomycetota bacterium]|nr:ribonuclease / adenosylcobalamin/alpha-ribazole phosphatase [Actinomycetota bacterium]
MTEANPRTTLVLIRHGESRAQEARIFSGHDTCSGLTELGRRQAMALRDRLARTNELGKVDALYTSILPRSIETAEILRPALGNLAPQAECEWCEIHAGDAEGHTYESYLERYPPGDDPDDPFRARFPGGETWAEFYVRVGTRLGRITREHPGETVVVVGHGGTIGASFVSLGDQPIRAGHGPTHEVNNTSITQWRWNARGWRLVRFNDAAHLYDL